MVTLGLVPKTIHKYPSKSPSPEVWLNPFSTGYCAGFYQHIRDVCIIIGYWNTLPCKSEFAHIPISPKQSQHKISLDLGIIFPLVVTPEGKYPNWWCLYHMSGSVAGTAVSCSPHPPHSHFFRCTDSTAYNGVSMDQCHIFMFIGL